MKNDDGMTVLTNGCGRDRINENLLGLELPLSADLFVYVACGNGNVPCIVMVITRKEGYSS